jgi:hypothetical protein
MTLGPRDPKPSANQWMDELLRQVNGLPEVEAAGAVYLRPLALGPIGQEKTTRIRCPSRSWRATRRYRAAGPCLAGEWVLAGIGLGLLCSIAATKAIGSMLFGVRGPDATTYAAVVTLVAAVVAIAAYLPARRAAFVDPMMLLKRD